MPAPGFEMVSATHGGHTVKIPFYGEAGRQAAEKAAAEFERTGEVRGPGFDPETSVAWRPSPTPGDQV